MFAATTSTIYGITLSRTQYISGLVEKTGRKLEVLLVRLSQGVLLFMLLIQRLETFTSTMELPIVGLV